MSGATGAGANLPDLWPIDAPHASAYNTLKRSPFFPRTDPYLEHPALWPDVHDSLIAAIRDALTPSVAPRYYVRLQRRAYLLKPDDMVFIGRPDIAVIPHERPAALSRLPLAEAAVVEVDVPMADEVSENFLEVHEVTTGKLVTILELPSPANKLLGKGREDYEIKRAQVFRSRTNLVEIDLLRAGEPMPVIGKPVQSDYRILVSRGSRRPHAELHAFTLRQAIPQFPLPLLPGDAEPTPVPPLSEADAAWARELIERAA